VARSFVAPARRFGHRRGIRRRPFVVAPYYYPYPVYSTPYRYRTCVIRKRWVHTRRGWHRAPRRVCFYRYRYY
jgi:hypothetical protein